MFSITKILCPQFIYLCLFFVLISTLFDFGRSESVFKMKRSMFMVTWETQDVDEKNRAELLKARMAPNEDTALNNH